MPCRKELTSGVLGQLSRTIVKRGRNGYSTQAVEAAGHHVPRGEPIPDDLSR